MVWDGPAARIFLAIFCGGSLVPAVAAQEPSSTADLRYALGSDFVGNATGRCEATGFLVEPGAAGAARFSSGSGVWESFEARFNTTTLGPYEQYLLQTNVGVELVREEAATPAGAGTITWQPGSRLHVYGAPGPLSGDTHPFEAAFSTTRFSTGALVDWVPTATLYVQHDLGLVAPYFYGLEGTNRDVDVADGLVHLRGDLTILLEDATAAWDAGAHRVAPPAQESTYVFGPWTVVAVEHHRVRYVLWTLHAAEVTFAADAGRLLCRGLDAGLEGVLNAYAARGRVERAGESVDVDRQELTLKGRFAWSEAPGEDDVRARGVGEFTAVDVDFGTVLGTTGPDWSWQRVGFWSLVVAGVGVVLYALSSLAWSTFSRLREEQVVGHPSRRLVLDAVEANPNVPLYRLTRLTGLSKSEVRYHARILEGRGLVRSHRVRRDRCFVARDTLRREGRGLLMATPDLVLQNDPVVRAVVERVPTEGIRLNPLLLRVATALGVSRVGAWKAVRRAEALGLVATSRSGREVWVRCAS